MPPHCIHSETGLCPDCQEQYDYDPESWLEYGEHEEGLKNRRRLDADVEEMRKVLRARPAVWTDEDLPF